MTSSTSRLYFLDYARALFIFLVVFDHTLHAYAGSFGKFWFVIDPDRDAFWDGVHLIGYAVMIPGLFFLAGIFTPDALERHGWARYTRDRVLKLLVPMGFGTVTVSPVLEYLKAQNKEGLNLDFISYYTSVYFQKDFALTGFWFLGYLFVLTIVYLVLVRVVPSLSTMLKRIGELCMRHTRSTFVIVGLMLAFSFAILTIRHGSFYWIGYRYFFTAIASFVGAYILMFALGIALGTARAHKNEAFLQSISCSFSWVMGFTVVTTALYLYIALTYIDDGAYSDKLPYFFYKGGSWWDALPMMLDEKVMILRAFLHGWVTWGLFVSTVLGLYRFMNRPIALWQTLAANSFVIYLIHEPFVLLQHVFFMNTSVPLLFRVVWITLTSLGLSWFLSEKLLRRVPAIRKVVG